MYDLSRIIRPSAFALIIIGVVMIPCLAAMAYTPPGSYQDTCKGIQVRGGLLIAKCRKANGDWVNSTILFQNCEGDISNNNGELTCRQKTTAKPPSGSYQRTCRNYYVEGKQLHGECRNDNGKWVTSSFKYKSCDSDIWNDDGELTCKEKRSSDVPGGSYQRSCRNYYVEGKKLYGDCRNERGKWVTSSFKYKSCTSDIWNDNGELTCKSKSDNHSDLPGGSYKKSCRNYYIEGKVLEAECRNDKGKWKHSSIKYKSCNKGIWNDNGQLRCN